MNVIPEQPNSECSSDDKPDNKRRLSDAVLIVVLTLLPFAILLLIWVAGLLNAEGWTALFSGLLVACTLVQAFIAHKQREVMEKSLAATTSAADAAKRSADVADRALRVAERGVLILGPMKLKRFYPGLAPRVEFSFKNAGHTAVYFTASKIRLGRHSEELKSPPDYGEILTDPTRTLTGRWLAPGQSNWNTVGFSPASFDGDDYWNVINGDLKVTVFGYIIFDDVFGVSRTLGFGLRYVPNKKRRGGHFMNLNLPGYNYERENPPTGTNDTATRNEITDPRRGHAD